MPKTKEKQLTYEPRVQAAAQKLDEHYVHMMLPQERKQLEEAMANGIETGFLSKIEAATLGRLTKKYPNKGVYVYLGWWLGTDNP